MQEILAQVISQARGAWRYRWYALLVAWVVAIAGWAVVYSMPDQYQSNTRVYADAESMLTPLLKGLAIRPNVHQRVRLVAKTLLSRPNLEKVARDTELNLRASNPKSQDALLASLQSRVTIKGGGRQNLYTISYVDHDPEKAQAVVQALLNILMTKTLNAPLQSSGAARSFLKDQVKEYRDRLASAERELTTFKKNHLGLVPGQGGSDYFGRLQGARMTLTNLNEQLDEAKSQRNAIQKQLESIKNGTASIAANPRIESIDKQITSYRKKLNNLLLRYTPKYPDVIAVKSMIGQLQQKRESIKNGGTPVVATTADSSNPVYQNMQTELYDSRVRINTLASKITRQKKRVANLESKANKVTDMQAKLKSLTRDYSVTQARYKDLLQRLDKAQMSQQASNSGNNLKFRVVEPPVVPLIASGPPRPTYLSVVLLFGLAAGGLFAVFLHQIRPVFMERETLKSVLGRPVLGVVSVARSNVERHLLSVEVAGFTAGVFLLVVVFGGVLAFQSQLTHLVQGLLSV